MKVGDKIVIQFRKNNKPIVFTAIIQEIRSKYGKEEYLASDFYTEPIWVRSVKPAKHE